MNDTSKFRPESARLAGSWVVSNACRQGGVALVVSLIFLLMLTILGVTVMQTASLEGRMAANSQETNRVFQAAQSAIDFLMSNDGNFGTLAPNTSGVPFPSSALPNFSGTNYADINIGATASVGCTLKKLPRMHSPMVYDLSKYTGAPNEIIADAKAGSGASNRTVQGFIRLTGNQSTCN